MKLRGNWSYPTPVKFGAGRISELATHVKAAGLKKPLLVTDKALATLPITARALDRLAGILEVGGHLLAPKGRLFAMKGVNPTDEIAELPAGWVAGPVHRLVVPGLEGERHLVEVHRG